MNDLVSLLATQGPAVVFLVTLAARLGAPVPAVPFLVVAGGLAVGGTALNAAAIVAASLLGNLLGDGAWFLAGRRWGYGVMRLLCRVSLSADTCVSRSESILGRWGGLSLIAAKYVPGVSVVAPPMAGAIGMSNARFLAYETAGALVWTLGYLLLGAVFHAAIRDVLAVLANIGLAATAVGGALLLAFLVWRYRQRRLARRADDITTISVDALRSALAQGRAPTVVDVRGEQVRALDPRAIPGAVGFALAELPHGLGALADGRELVLFCDCPDDASAVAAARVLMAAGLPRVRVLAGGLSAWTASDAQDTQPAVPAPLGAAGAA
ncbi:MAG: VTT domain-containing protein [Rhodocyclaceae bacterium]|nr:VTT domain-containing protein [Pseudomonadota bacterium]MDQ7974345.1 VTT domain-containing protein [Rhodocyclaceae bacterium]MDQ8002553.1 VTT domain-containing protein [Pseudomonadota bacterium]MDQ8018287.1 VTT domain-containing protein [Pseudomonadota bacterium]